jgi:hypothetical protein
MLHLHGPARPRLIIVITAFALALSARGAVSLAPPPAVAAQQDATREDATREDATREDAAQARELAERLLAYPYAVTDAGSSRAQLLVGRLPGDFAFGTT